MSGLAPKLRFSEFKDEWRSSTLAQIAVSISAGKSLQSEFGAYPIYGSTGQIGSTNQADYQTENILIARVGANAGKTYQVSGCYGVTDNTLIVSLIKEINKFFIFTLLSNINLNRYVFGSGQPLITGTMLKKLNIHIPSLPEQQKIANFISAIDTKIGAVKRKRAAFERYKKGLMQQIFSQKIRFKQDDGSEFPDWEEKRLGEIAKITTGKTPPTSDSQSWEGDLMFVTPTDINEGNKYQNKTNRYVSDFYIERCLPKGSILYTCIASIGKVAIASKSCITNQQINSLTVNKHYDNEFIYYVLVNSTPRIKTLSANTTLPIINKSDFSSIHILVPSLPEQQKIADFLSAIDTKIDAVTTQVQKLEAFKKGLLQQMLV